MLYSDLAWSPLINTWRFGADCLGFLFLNRGSLVSYDTLKNQECYFDYASEKYWWHWFVGAQLIILKIGFI